MNTNEWITDRLPTDEECISGLCVVYNALGRVTHIATIDDGEPWKPIPKCEPYVKPERWVAKYTDVCGCWVIYGPDWRHTMLHQLHLNNDAHREAAERIAAIYEEVVP